MELSWNLAGTLCSKPSHSLPFQTDRLGHLFEETVPESKVAAQGDPHAGWPGNVGCDLFFIATVCVRRKAKERPTMDQVRMWGELLCVDEM